MTGPEFTRTAVAGVMTIVNHKAGPGIGGFRLKDPFSAVNLPFNAAELHKSPEAYRNRRPDFQLRDRAPEPPAYPPEPTSREFEVRKSHRAPPTAASEIRDF